MEIVFFDSSVQKFLESTESSTRAKVSRFLLLLAERGHLVGMPHARNLGDGLYEARILGRQSIRIFYGFYGDSVVLLHAVTKKSQALKAKDIEAAEGRLSRLRGT